MFEPKGELVGEKEPTPQGYEWRILLPHEESDAPSGLAAPLLRLAPVVFVGGELVDTKPEIPDSGERVEHFLALLRLITSASPAPALLRFEPPKGEKLVDIHDGAGF